VTDLFAQPDDAATPLTPEEMLDLIPAHIAYRSELNAAERKIRDEPSQADAGRRLAMGWEVQN
jgi:hypothetical protein